MIIFFILKFWLLNLYLLSKIKSFIRHKLSLIFIWFYYLIESERRKMRGEKKINK